MFLQTKALFKASGNIQLLCILALQMDSGTSSFILSTSNFNSMYHPCIKEENAIDLGLSLRTKPPQPHQPASHLARYEIYRDLTRLSQMTTITRHDKTVKNDFECEEAGSQSRDADRWTYVKVNMDGVIIGRKICILNHGGYSSLALQLDDMFGSKSASGLRLFQAESEFSLLYKDMNENWRTVGDVSWNEFFQCVKRIRIALRS